MDNNQEITDQIFALATSLGQALKQNELLVALAKAKKDYEDDPVLKQKMTEYEVQEKVLQQEAGKPDRDSHFIDVIEARINVLYNEIANHPTFVALNEAQEKVNELMTRVNATITYNITGEDPTACTHNCATCGGKCH